MGDAPDRTPTVLTPARAVVAAGIVAAVVAVSISRTIPFDSDEANHANLALRQFQDLRDGRLLDFLRHSYRTGQFPFLHGWSIVPFFAALGSTEFAARVAHLLPFLAGTAAVAFAARRAAGGHRGAGGLAGTLFALSPALATYSGLCMVETPGAAAAAVALFCLGEALHADGSRAFRWDVATALAVLATWFTKLNYGMWVLPAVGLGYLVPAGRHLDRRRVLRGLATYVGVLVLVLGAWYASPSQRAAFHGFLTNPSQAVSVVQDDPSFRLPAFRADNFTAYFGLVAGDFHLHWTIGAAVLVLFAAGTWRGVRERNGLVVAAAACVAWTWTSLSMGFREYAMARFIAPALPALWVVAAHGARPLLDRADASRAARWAFATALAAGIAAQSLVVRARLPLEYEVDDRFRPVYAWLTESIPGPASVIVVNWTDHVSPRTLLWELSKQPGRSFREFDVKDASGERIYESTRNLDDWLARPRPWGGAGWTSVVVELDPGPEYLDMTVPATLAMWRGAVAAHAASGRFDPITERAFPGLDLRVRLWRDRTPPPHLGLGGD